MQAEYKLSLSPQTAASAASPADAILEGTQSQLGFVPNMYAAMANAPGLLDTYRQGYDHIRQRSGFTPAEQEVIFLTISRFHGCNYCMAAHSMIAENMSGTPADVVQAIRDDQAIADPRLAALNRFTRVLVESRGLPGRADVEDFLAAGYDEQRILQIVLAIAVKTLSNFSNHLFHTEVDAAFASHAWQAA